jgi:P27 family predicted phage terminase small subunit
MQRPEVLAMGARGPAKKPRLRVVREGNPGHRSKQQINAELVLPPEAPDEPDWSEWFPPAEMPQHPGELEVVRQRAHDEWVVIVTGLDAQGLLARLDRTVLSDHCVCAARILLLERQIAREGVSVMTERGYAKNPAVTSVNQYRTQLRYTLTQLGLSPAARARMGTPVPDDGDDENPFDA